MKVQCDIKEARSAQGRRFARFTYITFEETPIAKKWIQGDDQAPRCVNQEGEGGGHVPVGLHGKPAPGNLDHDEARDQPGEEADSDEPSARTQQVETGMTGVTSGFGLSYFLVLPALVTSIGSIPSFGAGEPGWKR